jgi:putative ABC transport system permease protein
MFKNYFKTAWRNILKYRFYSIVNVLGLSTGIAFSFLITGYVWSELQVNASLKNADDQYIVLSDWKDPNMGVGITTVGPLVKALKQQYPNLVANYYRWDGISSNVSKGDKHFREGLQVSDSTFLTMYGFPVLYGDARTALNSPNAVVITEEKAIKYFGKTNVVGQTLTIESFLGGKKDFIITAVMKSLQDNTVTQLANNNNQIFLSSSGLSFFGRDMEAWANQYIVSFIQLQPGISPRALEKPAQQLISKNTNAAVSQNLRIKLVSLKDYYLNANNGLVKKMLYTLGFIALFILIMAIINFINISISKSATRMREIGVRKVMGGLKIQLTLQFLIESVLLVFVATIFALFIYMGARSWFSALLAKEVPSLNDFPLYFLFIPVLITILVGCLAGIYPAWVLASLKSVDSLKGKLKSTKENIALRRSLVGFQFCIAAIVLIGAAIVTSQIALFFSKSLGYNKEYILSAQLPRDWTAKGVERMQGIRDQFSALPQIKDVTLSYEIPNGNNYGSAQIYKSGADSTQAITSQTLTTDERYAATYQIPMAAGTFFAEPGMPIDSTRIVINETQAKALGWQDVTRAVGQQLKMQGTPGTFTISGVTKDFHFGPMQQLIQPVTFLPVKLLPIYRYFSFKIKPGNIARTINAIEQKWAALMPGAAFEYNFMDDSLKKLYQTEIQLKKAAYTATVLSLIIVLLGIIGLLSLSIQKRTKEIGIRKVLGAPVAGILLLFMKEFLLVILVSGLVACPLAFMIMQHWLNGYAYRIPITPQPFIISILTLSVIAAILITVQTLKAALANPVASLRSE